MLDRCWDDLSADPHFDTIVAAAKAASGQILLRLEAAAKRISSWLRTRAPFNGRVVEVKRLNHKRSGFVEVLYCCAGPISCRASACVALAAKRNPFLSSQYVADTNRFFRIGWINGATLIEAPCPGGTVGATKDFLTLFKLFERECRVDSADTVRIGARLNCSARHRGHARAILHIARANCLSRVTWLWYAQSRCAKRILVFAQLHAWPGCLFVAKRNGEDCNRRNEERTRETQFDKAHT